jgi:hypothetical protein
MDAAWWVAAPGALWSDRERERTRRWRSATPPVTCDVCGRQGDRGWFTSGQPLRTYCPRHWRAVVKGVPDAETGR